MTGSKGSNHQEGEDVEQPPDEVELEQNRASGNRIKAPAHTLAKCISKLEITLQNFEKYLKTRYSEGGLLQYKAEFENWIERANERREYLANPAGKPSIEEHDALAQWNIFFSRIVNPAYAKLGSALNDLQKAEGSRSGSRLGSIPGSNLTGSISSLRTNISAIEKIGNPELIIRRINQDLRLSSDALKKYQDHIQQIHIDELAMDRISKWLSVLEQRDRDLDNYTWPESLEEDGSKLLNEVADMIIKLRQIIRTFESIGFEDIDEEQPEVKPKFIATKPEVVKSGKFKVDFRQQASRMFGPAKNAPNITPISQLNPSAPVYVSMADSMLRIQLQNSPLTVFSGNYVAYLDWREQTVKNLFNQHFPEENRFAKLIQYLEGEPKKLVQDLPYNNGQNVQDAFRKLDFKYANFDKLIVAQRKALDELPDFNSYNEEQGQHFINVVDGIISSTKSYNQDESDSQLLLTECIRKLPSALQFRWHQKKDAPKYAAPTLFESFSLFLNDSLNIGSLVQMMKVDKKKKDEEKPYKKRGSQGVSYAAVDSGEPTKYQPCSCCQGSHHISKCDKFMKLSIGGRVAKLQALKLCFRCLNHHFRNNCSTKPGCIKDKECKMNHHPLLHSSESKPDSKSANTGQASQQPKEKPNDGKTISGASVSIGQSAGTELSMTTVSGFDRSRTLRVIKVAVRAVGNQKERVVAALLDTGCNRTKLLESEAKKLNIPLNFEFIDQYGLNNRTTVRAAPIQFEVRGIGCKEWFPVDQASSAQNFGLPHFTLPTKDWPLDKEQICHLKGISYKDVKLVIGCDYERLFLPEQGSNKWIEMDKNRLLGYNTKLGWTVSADVQLSEVDAAATEFSYLIVDYQADWERNSLAELTSIFRNFNDTESFGVSCQSRSSLSKMEQCWLVQMEQSIRFEADGHFHIRPLWKENIQVPVNSEFNARNRLNGLMHRLDKDSKLADQYQKRFDDDVAKGYIRILSDEEAIQLRKSENFFLPHFPVFHPEKPNKVRRVFDAAAKSSGVSLNDMLYKGPNNLTSLFGVLLRFRVGFIAVNADICEMFPQVRVYPEDEARLSFLWKDIKTRQEKTCVIRYHLFGAASSPAIAIFAVHQAGKNFEPKYPGIYVHIKESFYVDDYYPSYDTIADANEGSHRVDETMSAHGFQLDKWCSNSIEFINSWPAEKQNPSVKEVKDKESLLKVKALGVHWDCTNDLLSFSSRKIKDNPTVLTDILSTLASIYDPLGLVGPFTFKGKLLLQQFWRKYGSWKAVLEDEDRMLWLKFVSDIAEVSKLSTPRWYGTKMSEEVVIHAFSDASESGFGSVVYITTDHSSMIVGSKSRIAPVRQLSVPRLELQGGLLSTRLVDVVQTDLNNSVKIKSIVLWTDSTAVLGWVKNESRRYVTFVANRIGEIQDTMDSLKAMNFDVEVMWVDGKLNPADYISRGLSASEFLEVHQNWIHGPEFLLDKSCWPKQPERKDLKESDLKSAAVSFIFASVDFPWKDYQDLNDFNQFLIDQLKESGRDITPNNISDVETEIIGQVQSELFEKEIKRLARRKGGRMIPHTGDLRGKEVFLDEDKLLRLVTRLESSGISEFLPPSSQFPIILPSKHPLTGLIIRDAHHQLNHLGRQSTKGKIRSRFYIPFIDAAVRRELDRCETCIHRNPRRVNVPLAPLHRNRLHMAGLPPFSSCGMDFFGPLVIASGAKVYGLLFTCMTVRAIHLEACKKIDTTSCLLAIDRFISRRNIKPINIQCDQGSSFIAADNDISSAIKKIAKDLPAEVVKKFRLQISFNAAGSPNQGGAWERLIKDVKRCIKSSVNSVTRFSYEAFETLLVRVEGIMNNRPLAFDDSGVPLSPGMFLNPAQFVSESLPFSTSAIKLLNRVRNAEVKFWHDWKHLYLFNLSVYKLQRKGRFIQIKVGDDVLIDDSKSKIVNVWSPGKVVKVYPSVDGIVRAADIETPQGIVHRGLSRIFVNEAAVLDDSFWNSPPANGGSVSAAKPN